MTQESIFTTIGRTTKSLVNERLPLSGGSLSGPLLLSGSPTQGFEAATKGYVDNELSNLIQYARLDGADFTGDVTGTNLILSGDLTVNGAVTTLNTTNSTISDSLILLSKGASDSQNASNDSGIVIERGSGEDNAAMYWDETDELFKLSTTTADATATNLGGTSTSASLEIADLKTNGNELGTMEQFLGNVLTSIGTASILRSEFDAVANNGVVVITGTNSPFPTTAITTTYGTPSEIIYKLSEVSNDGTSTIVSVEVNEVSQSAFNHLTSTGSLTIGTEEITFN